MARKARRNKVWGIILIVAGVICLMLPALWFSAHFKLLERLMRVETRETTENVAPYERPEIEVPVPTGSEELKTYYANTPRENKASLEVKDEDEGYEYYTRPDGSAWIKDSNNTNIAGDVKKGNQNYTPEPLHTDRPLHVEFWESAVNYKGYQLKGNNLFLYGIDPNDSLRFERHENTIWMYHQGRIYLLKPNREEAPFELLDPAEERASSGNDGSTAGNGAAGSGAARDGSNHGAAGSGAARGGSNHGAAGSGAARDGSNHGGAGSGAARDGSNHGAASSGTHNPNAPETKTVN